MRGPVVSVDESIQPSNYVGDSPSGASRMAGAHSYEVIVHAKCAEYKARYYSAFDYLPQIRVSNRQVEVRPQRHVIDVILPAEQAFRMALLGRPPSLCSGTN
jgi:hypothetical protein